MTKCFLEEANIHIKDFFNLYKLKTWSKFHDVLKTRMIKGYWIDADKLSS